MTQAFLTQDQTNFNNSIKQYNNWVNTHAKVKLKSTHLEFLYNKFDFFYRANLLYGLALLLFLIWSLKPFKWLLAGNFSLIAIALLLHTAGIIFRMLILSRPPVTNLYDTFLFVGWICVILGLLVEWIQKK